MSSCSCETVRGQGMTLPDCNLIVLLHRTGLVPLPNCLLIEGVRDVGGGGNSLRPYSQQRPMRTNLSCCLGLIDNGQYKSTNRLLVLVPHERPHGIMRMDGHMPELAIPLLFYSLPDLQYTHEIARTTLKPRDGPVSGLSHERQLNHLFGEIHAMSKEFCSNALPVKHALLIDSTVVCACYPGPRSSRMASQYSERSPIALHSLARSAFKSAGDTILSLVCNCHHHCCSAQQHRCCSRDIHAICFPAACSFIACSVCMLDSTSKGMGRQACSPWLFHVLGHVFTGAMPDCNVASMRQPGQSQGV